MKLVDVIRFGKNFKVDDAHRFAKHVVPEVIRPARIIWNQAIGGLFLILFLFSLLSGINYYRQENPAGLALCSTFAAVMGFFAVASFWKARKLGRPRVPSR